MDVSRFSAPDFIKKMEGLKNNDIESARRILLFLERVLKFKSASVYQLCYCSRGAKKISIYELLSYSNRELSFNSSLTTLSIEEFSDALSPAPDHFLRDLILKESLTGDCVFWCDANSLLGVVEITKCSKKIIFNLKSDNSGFSKSNYFHLSSLLPLLISCHFFRTIDDIRLRSRESEVLKWAMLGKSTSEIATILAISESTVSFHFNSIYKKLNVTSRAQAVAKAIQYGLVSVPLQ